MLELAVSCYCSSLCCAHLLQLASFQKQKPLKAGGAGTLPGQSSGPGKPVGSGGGLEFSPGSPLQDWVSAVSCLVPSQGRGPAGLAQRSPRSNPPELSALGFSSGWCGIAPSGCLPVLIWAQILVAYMAWPTVPLVFLLQLPRTSEGISESYPAFLQVPSQLPLLSRGEIPLEPAHTPSPRAQIPGQPHSSLPRAPRKPPMPGQQPLPTSPCPPLVRPHSSWAKSPF